MKVYLDSNYMCHRDEGNGLTPYEHERLDVVPYAAIENYRVIPEEASWTDPTGRVWNGLLIQEVIPTNNAIYLQSGYDRDNMMSLEEAAGLIDLIYQCDLELIG